MRTEIPLLRTFGVSGALFARASDSIAGGVTSAVRAGALPHPLYFDRGVGPRIWDVDGNEYVDYAMAFGPLILGHSPEPIRAALHTQIERATTFGSQHRLELDVAEMLTDIVPGAEQAVFSSTGSEAVAAALRIARAATGRSKVLKFEGHYHGWLDGIAVSTGFDRHQSGDAKRPTGYPSTGGIPASAMSEVVVAPWNDLSAVQQIVTEHAGEFAAIILEPCLVNGGVIEPVGGFLEGLRRIATGDGALLIFDEVITGFRLALGGAQERYGVTADLAVFAKALASGVPMSAVTGGRDVMKVVADGTVSHNGTFNGNPLVACAAAATLRHLRDNASEIYPRMELQADGLATGLAAASSRLTVRRAGPIVHTAVDEPSDVTTVRDRTGDSQLHGRFIERLLHHGVHATARGLWYVSTAHGPDEISFTVDAARRAAADVL